MPVRRKAPVKVVVFQWPCGTAARQRWPRGARPLSRAILVEAPVSSMKTRCSGSRSGWAANQDRRRAPTSGRSCSAACAVFFERHRVTVEKPPDRAGREGGTVPGAQQLRKFDKADVLLGLNCRQDRRPESFDAMRARVTALRLGAHRARGVVRANPSHRTGR